MKIFVTGATGYLGFHFVKEVVSLGHQVLCLRRISSKSMFDSVVESKIEWINIEDSKLKDKVS